MAEFKENDEWMIIAVDIGNSNVVMGWHDGNTWVHMWRIPTATHQEAAYYYDVEVRNKILEAGINPIDVEDVILSTVVPSLKEVFVNILEQLFGHRPVLVGPNLYERLRFSVPRPYEIGSDLVANAYGAYRLYNRDIIVVDFGTALTFTTVKNNGSVEGVAIAPGIKTAMRALSSNTAQLPEIPLILPSSVLGQNTTHAIQAGILWGYVGIAKELLAKIREEVGDHYQAVATGGLSFIMQPLDGLFNEINPTLTMDGLRLMLEALKHKKS